MAKKRKKKQEPKDQELYMYIISTIIIVVICIALFKFGVVGLFLNNIVRFLFGDFYYAACIIGLILASIILLSKKKGKVNAKMIVASICLLVAILLWSATFVDKQLVGFSILTNFLSEFTDYFKEVKTVPANGGFIGALLYSFTSILFAREGTWFLAIALVVLAIILILSLESFKEAIVSIKNFFALPAKWREEEVEYEEVEEYYEDAMNIIDMK